MTCTRCAAATSWPPNLRLLTSRLALGADFGGNLTAVGASANVVMLGIARRSEHPIAVWEFTRKGVLVTTMSIALSTIYLWLRSFITR